MKLSRLLLRSGALLFLGGASLFAQGLGEVAPPPPQHPATPEQVREYFEITGMKALTLQMIKQGMEAYRAKSKANIPASIWDEVEREYLKVDFASAMTPGYQRYISEEDMAVALTYYRSATAKKLEASGPVLLAATKEELLKRQREIFEKVAREHADEIRTLMKKNAEEAEKKSSSQGHPK